MNKIFALALLALPLITAQASVELPMPLRGHVITAPDVVDKGVSEVTRVILVKTSVKKGYLDEYYDQRTWKAQAHILLKPNPSFAPKNIWLGLVCAANESLVKSRRIDCDNPASIGTLSGSLLIPVAIVPTSEVATVRTELTRSQSTEKPAPMAPKEPAIVPVAPKQEFVKPKRASPPKRSAKPQGVHYPKIDLGN